MARRAKPAMAKPPPLLDETVSANIGSINATLDTGGRLDANGE
jgi:hypothetical protein